MVDDETDAQQRIARLEQELAHARQTITGLEEEVAQREAEARSDSSSIRFQALFQHALDAILIADDEGRYVDANPAAAQLFGVSRDELLGKTVADFGPPDLDFAAVWQNFLNSEAEEGEFPVYRPDGTVRYAEYAAVPDFLPGRHLSILRDVTERKRLLQELRELATNLERRVEKRTEALEQRSQQLRAVASALTVAEQRERERISQILHDDLQQLLHAAQLRLMMLEADLMGSAGQSVQEGLAALEGLHEHALAVTRSLTVELSPPVLEGEGLAVALAWLAGHMDDVYGLQVEFASDDEVEPLSADLAELTFQMVREMLFNVVKHAGVDRAHLIARRRDNHCLITVADEGAGFDPASLAQAEAESAGYGLHSIRERLALFGGSVAVEAAPGAGTRVTLTLPCAGSLEDGAPRGENG